MPPNPHHPQLRTPWSGSDRLLARVLAQPLQQFVRTEAAGGMVLLAAAVAALVWANSPWSSSYEQVWNTELAVRIGNWQLTHVLRDWVNDLAMALFFFVAGLEIKRELAHGELRSARSASLPVACAIGGMAAPAAIFLALNAGTAGARGWGVPMATYIAFSLGVLALPGKRLPTSMKVFLLTLAIVDDIGAIMVIALFYSADISPIWLGVAVACAGAILAVRRIGVHSLIPYLALAALMWFATLESGVHATIAGVVLGLLTPARPLQHPATVQRVAIDRLDNSHLRDEVADEEDETSLLEVASLTTDAVSPLGRLERRLHPWSSFVVLPLFALSNAGVAVSRETVSALPTNRPSVGIIVGLVVGKPVGIMAAAVVAVWVVGARLPSLASWGDLAGAGALAGIGFTVSLFVAGLGFDGAEADQARLAVLVSSVIAGALGAAVLSTRRRTHEELDPRLAPDH